MKPAEYTLTRKGIVIRAEFIAWSHVPRRVAHVRLHIEGRTKNTIRDVHLCLTHGPIGDEPAFGIYSVRPHLPARWHRQGTDAAWNVCLEQKIAEEKASQERGEKFVDAVCGPSAWGRR